MTLTIELPETLQAELTDEASKANLPLPEYIVRILGSGRLPTPMPKTGADVVAYWHREKLIGRRTDIADSSKQARELRERGLVLRQPCSR
jgi:hypothetical protein